MKPDTIQSNSERNLLEQIKKILADVESYLRDMEENYRKQTEEEKKRKKRITIVFTAGMSIFISTVIGLAIYGTVSNSILNKVMPLQESAYESSPLNGNSENPYKELAVLYQSIKDYKYKNRKYPENADEIAEKISPSLSGKISYTKSSKGFTLKMKEDFPGMPSYNEKGIQMPFSK